MRGGGGGAAVAMLLGDDAGNDIYKQLGAMLVLGTRAGCMGRSYSPTTTTITVCTIHSLPYIYLAGPAGDGMGPLWSTNNQSPSDRCN